MLQFEKQNEDALQTILNSLGARDVVLNYQQIHGLLYAMASSPEPIAASEWFELIWLSDAPQFDDPADANTFYQLLLSLFRAIETDIQAARYRPGMAGAGSCSALQLADWCDGFLMGHQYLEEVWSAALDQINDDRLYEQVDAVLCWAMAFVDGSIVDECVEDDDDRLLTEHLSFEQMLVEYRAVGLRASAGEPHLDLGQVFAAMQPVARDEACPCGSGRMFARCCLH